MFQASEIATGQHGDLPDAWRRRPRRRIDWVHHDPAGRGLVHRCVQGVLLRLEPHEHEHDRRRCQNSNDRNHRSVTMDEPSNRSPGTGPGIVRSFLSLCDHARPTAPTRWPEFHARSRLPPESFPDAYESVTSAGGPESRLRGLVRFDVSMRAEIDIMDGVLRRQHILIVEDDPTVSEVVARYLEREGFEVETVADGRAALDRAKARPPDAMVLDLMLPGLDGLEVFRQLRSFAPTPVIMLTARANEDDRVLGLELGADDYVSKPFSPRELTARVKSVLRRAESPVAASDASKVVAAGEITVDVGAREVRAGD